MYWPVRRPLVVFACLLALLEIAVLALPSSPPTTPFTDSSRQPWRCNGVVSTDPEPRQHGLRLTVDLEQCSEGLFTEFRPVYDRVRLFVPTELRTSETLWEGDRIRFAATFREPRDFRNPAGFSYRRFLRTKGISAVGTIIDPRLIVRLDAERSHPFQHALVAFRHRLIQTIDDHVPRDAASVLKAVTIGVQGEIDRDLRDDFAHSGLAHLLSISGLHVGLLAVVVALVVSLLLRSWPVCFLFLPRWPMIALLSLPLVWLYIVLAGAPIPAVRAGIMMTIFATALIFGKRQDALSTLAAAAIVIMIAWPSAVGDISFQLSVMALLGMILLVPERRLGWFRRTLVTTFAATIATLPLVAYHFHFVSPLGLVTNLVAVPLAGFILMPLAAIGVILTFFNLSWAIIVWKIAAVPTQGLIHLAKITSLSGAPAILPWAPSFLQVALCYLFLGTVRKVPLLCKEGLGEVDRGGSTPPDLPLQRGGRVWMVRAIVAAALVTSIAWPFLQTRFSNDLEVVFFDVGQGDAALVRFPGGTAWMIDGGGLRGSDFDIGRFVLAPALWRLGVYRLETLVVSHPHFDHYGGLSYLAEHFSLQEVWITGAEPPEEERETWGAFLTAAMEAEVTVRIVSADNPPVIRGGVAVNVLHPRTKDLAALDINNSSLVISLSRIPDSGSRTPGFVLFTGDLEEEGERMLVASGKLGQHEILKVGHHGSHTSTSESFLRAVQPKIAIISVGAENRYGMPSDRVLKQLEDQGVNILRTDQDGAVRYQDPSGFSHERKVQPKVFRSRVALILRSSSLPRVR